jgi:hypothetical protein
MKAKPPYPWRNVGGQRWELLLMGDPDCYAYIIRHYSNVWKSAAWCWLLTMPRGNVTRTNGWARAPHLAKRQVEAVIEGQR